MIERDSVVAEMNRMQRRLAALAFGSLLATISGWSVFALVDPIKPPNQPAIRPDPFELARNQGNAVRQRILDDISAGTQPSWAGTYAWSDGYVRHHLDLSVRGYFYEHSSCTGTILLSFGEVDAGADGLLTLSQRVQLDRRGWSREPPLAEAVERTPSTVPTQKGYCFEPTMFSVPWGKETFLVPASLMQDFCALVTAHGPQAVKRADYPRRMRSEDDRGFAQPELTGLPDVPPEFRRYLPASASGPDERR